MAKKLAFSIWKQKLTINLHMVQYGGVDFGEDSRQVASKQIEDGNFSNSA